MSTPGSRPGDGPGPAATSPAHVDTPAPRPIDPERGLRGVMSAILIFEAVTILLGLTVIANGGVSGAGWQLGAVAGLAALHLAVPAVISKRYALTVIWALQALLVGCWAIHAAIGAMGLVFGSVWVIVMLMRREFRRRLAAGVLPSAADQPSDPGATDEASRESR